MITYEHDHYVDVTKECRRKSREYLQSKGYVLAVSDVSPDGKSNFEDWWVHPDLVDPELLKKMQNTKNYTKKAETHMLSQDIPPEPEPEDQPVSFSVASKNSVWIVDNFYDDPDAIREFALSREFDEGGFGRRIYWEKD